MERKKVFFYRFYEEGIIPQRHILMLSKPLSEMLYKPVVLLCGVYDSVDGSIITYEAVKNVFGGEESKKFIVLNLDEFEKRYRKLIREDPKNNLIYVSSTFKGTGVFEPKLNVFKKRTMKRYTKNLGTEALFLEFNLNKIKTDIRLFANKEKVITKFYSSLNYIYKEACGFLNVNGDIVQVVNGNISPFYEKELTLEAYEKLKKSSDYTITDSDDEVAYVVNPKIERYMDML